MIMRYALIFQGKVINVLDWDGDLVKWQPPIGYTILQTEQGSPGDTWDGQKFTTPAVPSLDYTAAQIDAYIDGITSLAELRIFLKRLVKYMVVRM